MSNQELAAWYIHQLTRAVDTVMDWRCIHDQKKDLPAHNYRGTLEEIWGTLQKYNDDGYGIFCNINALDGQGRELSNVQFIRAHVVDLDNVLTAQANYDRANASFAVQSSPGKYHLYWKVEPYVGNDFFTVIQRKIAQFYDGDKTIIDATRVLRVPGFMHRKGDPVLVTAWPLADIDRIRTSAEFEAEFSHVSIIDHMSTRSPLGTSEMAAPDLEWLKFAIGLVDPNDLDRAEWLSFSAAIKQAGWNHTDPDTLLKIWSDWCDKYTQNDAGENLKLWNSIADTEVGWKSIERKSPVKAYMMFGNQAPAQTGQTDTYGEILSEHECQSYFKDCYFVNRTGEIFTNGRFMKSSQFNGMYGGKQFIITSTGKLTDEPWKAALRSTCWQIPKVDHVRFLPNKKPFEIILDALGRKGLNTYIPIKIKATEGDISPWLDHVNKILPNSDDQRMLFEYMAHCVKFPGNKIPWAPLLQSAEGIGKMVFFEVMRHALGDMYVYSPKAQDLNKSGSTFNAWMRGKLLIVVNEIKIDEKRELIEILKPMITDDRVEIQSKGVDQDMEDNPANWLFFSNFKDAIPISQNGRRYSIFYSVLQSKSDILNAGMDDKYFINMFKWLRDGGGLEAITYWFLNYPIECGALPVRAPETSSHAEALLISQSPMEAIIRESIEDGIPGFRGGYISTIAVLQKSKDAGIRKPSTRTVQTCLEAMGFVSIGRSVRPYMQEDVSRRTNLYSSQTDRQTDGYGAAQGYE